MREESKEAAQNIRLMLQSVENNMEKTNVLRKTLHLDNLSTDVPSTAMATITEENSLEQLNAFKNAMSQNDLSEVYFLKQDTPDIFFLDFESKRFVKKTINQRIPVQAKSLQVMNGDIYIIGGFCRNEQSKEN